MSQLQTKNAAVLGVSTDSVDSHKRFVEKEHLNFSLLADTEKAFRGAKKGPKEALFVDDRVHLSRAGHELVAETVLDAIEANGR